MGGVRLQCLGGGVLVVVVDDHRQYGPAGGVGAGLYGATVPDTEAWMVALRPSASPIFWPSFTDSPALTRGVQGLPMC